MCKRNNMKHFRIKASKKYLYDDYKYYPQYRKNILCQYRYLKIEDVRGLDLHTLNKPFNYSWNTDSENRVFLESLKDAKVVVHVSTIVQRFMIGQHSIMLVWSAVMQ